MNRVRENNILTVEVWDSCQGTTLQTLTNLRPMRFVSGHDHGRAEGIPRCHPEEREGAD